MAANSPIARHQVINWQDWPPARKRIAIQLCTEAGKDLKRPIYKRQERLAHELHMGEGSYPREERALIRDGFLIKETVKPGGRYPNGKPAPQGGRILCLSPLWFEKHRNDVPPWHPLDARPGSSTSKSRKGKRSARNEAHKRVNVLNELNARGVSKEEIRLSLGGGPPDDAPVELLTQILDQPYPTSVNNSPAARATDHSRSPEPTYSHDREGSADDCDATDPSGSRVRTEPTYSHDPEGSVGDCGTTDPPGSLIRTDHLDTREIAERRGEYSEEPCCPNDSHMSQVADKNSGDEARQRGELISQILRSGMSTESAERNLGSYFKNARLKDLAKLARERSSSRADQSKRQEAPSRSSEGAK